MTRCTPNSRGDRRHRSPNAEKSGYYCPNVSEANKHRKALMNTAGFGRSIGRLKKSKRTDGEDYPCCERSEERRVGKECRSRWSPYPEKKTRTIRKTTRCATATT